MAKGTQHLKALEESDKQRRLSKEELLRPQIAEEEVPIEALGGSVLLRSMSHAIRQELRNECGWGSSKEQFDEDKFTLLSIVYSIVEPKLTAEDVEALAKQDGRIIDELVGKITLLNMFGKSEELKKE